MACSKEKPKRWSIYINKAAIVLYQNYNVKVNNIERIQINLGLGSAEGVRIKLRIQIEADRHTMYW